MVLDDKHRPCRFIEAGDDTVKINERSLSLHCYPQADVIAVVRICAPIAITEESAVDKSIIVRSLPVLDWRSGRDSERDLGQESGFEDALGTDQRDPDAFKVEASLQYGARDRGFGEPLSLLAHEIKGAQANCCVAVLSHGYDYLDEVLIEFGSAAGPQDLN